MKTMMMTEPTKMATMMMLTKVFHCWQLRHREHLVLRWTAHPPHFFNSQYCKTPCKQCVAVGQVMDHGDFDGDGDGDGEGDGDGDGDTLPLSSLPGLTHTWWAAAIHTMTTQRYSLFFWS